jgi:hypothetical protein
MRERISRAGPARAARHEDEKIATEREELRQPERASRRGGV